MRIGSTGFNVTNLQSFLASDSYIYPAARVTGYYGGLTAAAVSQFQVNYDIPMVGVVGPMTLSKINSIINAGRGIDIYAPTIFGKSVQKSNTSATFNWSTTESAGGKVYYSTSPMGAREAISNFSEPIITGGSVMPAMNSQLSQAVTITGLQANTVYYYILEAQDASGNVSVTVQSSFTTNQ